MELIKIAEQIERRIKLLESCRKMLKGKAQAKAEAISEYDKQIEMEVMKAKEDNPASLCKDIAKGRAKDYRFKMDIAESDYKSLNTAIESIKAELNGYQSIFRHLDEK